MQKKNTEIYKNQSFFNSYLIKDAFYGYKRYLLFGFLVVVGAVGLSFLTPLVITFVIDFVISNEVPDMPGFLLNIVKEADRKYLLDNIWIPALLIVLITMIAGIFIFLRLRISAQISEGVSKRLKDRLYSHIQNLPYDYFKHISAGDIVQRCTSDVETIRRFVSVQMMEILRTLVMIVISMTVMVSVDYRMALVSSSLLPILFIMSFLFFKSIKSKFTISDEAEGRLSTVIQENLSGVRVVRAFGQQQAEVDKFEKANSEFKKVTTKLINTMAKYWGASDMLTFLQIALTVVVGTLLAVKGELTVGNVILFTTYVSMLVWPVKQMGRILSDFGKAVVSVCRLEEITDEEEEREPGLALKPEIKGEIRFEGVCFGYEDSDHEVLEDITFEIKPGETMAILGSTGSGKTSLVQLIQRLYEVNGGAIYIDGVNVNDIERHHLRNNIGIVLQEPFLYSKTIMENIKISKPDISDRAVYEVANIAAIHNDIESFEKGYETEVGERGVTVSGGQKQRIAIARTLIQQAPILIFDDSLSAVDTETDKRIREALLERRQNTTTILISHRIVTLSEADVIIVLDNGRIVERGSHDELVKSGGMYSKIARIQSEYADEDYE
ncbi:MAG: ABC transporter ATP-binding protein [Ruminococcaceae bacterium]|nr:ABC transporter ATP-binding protein [Oscillospiraceae bacterium]